MIKKNKATFKIGWILKITVFNTWQIFFWKNSTLHLYCQLVKAVLYVLIRILVCDVMWQVFLTWSFIFFKRQTNNSKSIHRRLVLFVTANAEWEGNELACVQGVRTWRFEHVMQHGDHFNHPCGMQFTGNK